MHLKRWETKNMVQVREAILRYDVGDMQLKDVLICISILDDLVQKDWNADQRKRGLMLMELRDYTVEYVIKNICYQLHNRLDVLRFFNFFYVV
jgi:hypothetical protein